MADTNSPDSTPPRRSRRWPFQLAVVGLVAVSALAGTGLARLLRGPTIDAPATEEPVKKPIVKGKMPGDLFLGWDKPDLVVVLSGQQNGYLLPCGCSKPQVGGLERRYNFLQMLKDRGWAVMPADLGDIPQVRGPMSLPNVQGLIKYRYSMMALKEMGYTAVGIGQQETGLNLATVLDEYPLNFPTPRVVPANLLNAEVNYPGETAPWELADPTTTNGIRVGVTSVLGPTVVGRIKDQTHDDKKVRFGATPAALDDVLQKMEAAKVDLRVLLYQGPLRRPGNTVKDPPTEAMACAAAYPQFPIVMCLSEEDDPPSRPIEVTTKTGTTSWLINLGRKGKFLGAVGVWKTGKADRPYTFRYQLVEMTEDFLTPDAKEASQPILKLMEDYTQELARLDSAGHSYLQRYGQVKHVVQAMPPVPGLEKPGDKNDPTYVGSATCKRCHSDAYKIWQKTPHSYAYKTLVDARKPSNRQFDPECIVCHTVGFGYRGGFVDAKTTEHLKDVGCESCHGPASLHVKNPDNPEWQARLNPWKLPASATTEQKKKQRDQMDWFCQKCHDIDNDVTWLHGGFDKKWPKIEHPTAKAPAPPPPPR